MPVDDRPETRPTRQCLSCGAIVELPTEQVSGSCPYCASQLVDVERSSASFERVAPFRVSKRVALERLRLHLAGRFWAPGSLRSLAASGQVAAQVRGVLVPFYAYDAQCRSTYDASIGIHWYRSERVKGKDGKSQTKRIEETEWFPLRGTAVGRLRGHLESASTGLDAGDIAGLGGFDLGRAVGFDPHLLAGWQAELPSRARAHVDSDAVQRVRKLESRRILHTLLPGDTHRRARIDSTIEFGEVKLVLLPVWITAYRHGGKVYRMLVHGQTGRCHGAAPVARAKVAAAAVAVAAIGVLVLWLAGVWRG